MSFINGVSNHLSSNGSNSTNYHAQEQMHEHINTGASQHLTQFHAFVVSSVLEAMAALRREDSSNISQSSSSSAHQVSPQNYHWVVHEVNIISHSSHSHSNQAASSLPPRPFGQTEQQRVEVAEGLIRWNPTFGERTKDNKHESQEAAREIKLARA